ncbi:MAG: hypothetical protein E7168_00855 [Firmicutes bacterium]|nr:hypothetical protein [Bacillota bacterium]
MKEKYYCSFCGAINDSLKGKCNKCHRKLDSKEHPFLEYLSSKVSDKYVGDLKENAYSIIINYLKSHLYGFILSCSVLITTASIIVNATEPTNSIQKVTEKPSLMENITYIGEGLTSFELTEKYLTAIKENDKSTIYALQLENNHPEVLNYIKKNPHTNIYSINEQINPILEHNLVKNGPTYYKENKGTVYIGDSDLVYKSGKYGEYSFERWIVVFRYCLGNTCRVENGQEQYTFVVRNQIELIEVDGNYYVSGENLATFMGVSEQIEYLYLMKENGLTSNMTEEKYNYYVYECEDIETCFDE